MESCIILWHFVSVAVSEPTSGEEDDILAGMAPRARACFCKRICPQFAHLDVFHVVAAAAAAGHKMSSHFKRSQ